MRLEEAMEIIRANKKPASFRVHYEVSDGQFLTSSYYPEHDESGFTSEAAAWNSAKDFAAAASPNYYNIYVVDAKTYVPVEGYEQSTLRRH